VPLAIVVALPHRIQPTLDSLDLWARSDDLVCGMFAEILYC